ncbi:hypothetical protein MC7420_1846 [Coleofasciculus chthonoplastes PCC 7420]|uniref:DUF1980 domain-containing protein n=1 Tax=Coleofasciculus chthonoplastes PCC 7420 TaxID=118168 RepID=B4VMF5_9CYAN|nr:hypothetical protein MC7420_1846 [Coleofasciculus chthonoplastes PCC 7420]
MKLPESRNAYKPDTWIQVKGTMMTETLQDKRQLVIDASEIETVPEPDNPYYY